MCRDSGFKYGTVCAYFRTDCGSGTNARWMATTNFAEKPGTFRKRKHREIASVASEETAVLIPLVVKPVQVEVALGTVPVEIRDVEVAVHLRGIV